MEHYLKNRTNMMSCSRSWRNPNMADTTIFSTFIYGISVMFADIITSDMPIIINNDVIA